MKTCTKCNNNKNDSDFYSKVNEHRTASWCKRCFNDFCMNRWLSIKSRIINQFGNKCADCEKTFPYVVYDFHHTKPASKEFNWDKMKLLSEDKRQHELSKCVLLCANCHRIRHYTEKQILSN